MANKKINDLPVAGSIIDTMQLETDISGTTPNKVTSLQMKTYVLGGPNVVNSVFTRTGDVVALLSDYDASQVDNDSTVVGATVKDALETLESSIPVMVEDVLTVSSDGQTAFTLSDTPSGDESFKLYLNGQLAERSVDYTRAGTALTWINGGSLGPLETTDYFVAYYNDGAIGSAPISSVFTRTGAIVAAASDYDASQVDNDSGVAGAYVSDALDQLDTDIGTKAASGANSDITSLSGLTTPLSIAQGGTNSGTALANGRVMQSLAGAVVESAVDISSLSSTKSHIIYSEGSANYGNRRVRAVGATGSYRLNFNVPKDFTGTLTVKVIFYPVSGAGGVGKDVDIIGEYTNAAGASTTQYTFSDTTSTYNLGTDDTRTELDITSLFTNLAAGSEGGLLWDNNGVGGTTNIVGIEITNT